MTESTPPLPFSRPFAAVDVPEGGLDVTIEATREECDKLATAFALLAVHRLRGILHLSGSPGRLRVTGRVEALPRQVCVVTLEPFDAAVKEDLDVTFAAPSRLSSATSRDRGPTDKEPPDEIVDGMIDLGVLATEFLALGLDPYPRKPGADFSFPCEDAAAPSPFAALARLKPGEPGAS